MAINFLKWACNENVCLFIYMGLFYSYKFSNMGIQGNESSFFYLKLKSLSEVGPKHTTQISEKIINLNAGLTDNAYKSLKATMSD